jgi:hypothetical protein
MRRFLRGVAVVLAGFVAASLVMMTVESLNGRVFYPGLAKAAEGIRDREAMRALMAQAPVGALLVVAFGWALGGLTGGWTTAKLSPQGTLTPVVLLGALLLLAGVANDLMLPPPAWFWVVGLVALGGGVLAGARLARRSD